jgi:hypothetical protein
MLGCDANQYKVSVKTAEAENDRGTIECRGNHLEFESSEFFARETIKAERLLRCLPMDVHLFFAKS